MIIRFTKEKETKNTIRYQETHHDGVALSADTPVVIGPLYVQKSAASNRDVINVEFPLDGE